MCYIEYGCMYGSCIRIYKYAYIAYIISECMLLLMYGIPRVLVPFGAVFFFFRRSTLTGKCGKRARPDILYRGSAEEEVDDDDDERIGTISSHYDILV